MTAAAMAAIWDDLLRTVRWYPSPHNSQPLRVRVVDTHRAEIYYDLDRGLPAEPYGIPFGSVCAGIFVELFVVAAHGLGFAVDVWLNPDDMEVAGTDRLHLVGVVTLVPSGGQVADLYPALIAARATSRLPYTSRPVAPDVIARVSTEARAWGHRVGGTTDREVVRAVARLNQHTLFDDIANPAVREELTTWLRFSPAEAARSGDGLSARCLHLPGPVLRWFFTHHALWRRRVPGAIARWLHLRSMRGLGQLLWITGPFATTSDHQRAGRAFIRLWLMLTAAGVAVHPFGSVITNPRSHAVFTGLVDEDQGDQMTWMLLRIGHSAPPPGSHRRPASALLVTGEHAA